MIWLDSNLLVHGALAIEHLKNLLGLELYSIIFSFCFYFIYFTIVTTYLHKVIVTCLCTVIVTYSCTLVATCLHKVITSYLCKAIVTCLGPC